MNASVLALTLFLSAPALAAQDYHPPVDPRDPSSQGQVIFIPAQPAPFAVQQGEKQAGKPKAQQARKQAAKSAGQAEPKVWLGLALRERQDGPTRLEVDEVFPDSPAASVDFRVGDKLVAVDGRATARHTDVLDALKGHKVGDRVSVTVERSVAVTLGKSDQGEGQPFLGVTPQTLDDRRPEWKQGASIDSAMEGTAARAAGLRAGERICAVDGVELSTFEELRKAVRSKQPGDQIELRIQADLNPSLAARRTQEGARAGADSSAESPHAIVPPPPQPPPAGDGGWSWNSGPKAGAPGAPQPFAPQAGPGPQGEDQRAPGAPAPLQRRGAAGRAPQAASDNAQELRGLLDELRGLRRELGDLRRELETLREQQQR